jgi:NADH-quinone oxidoreductase subunit L
MFRLYFSIFWNKEAPSYAKASESKEGSWAMMLPLIVLAVAAAVAGFIPFGNFVSSDGSPLESKFHLEFSMAPVLLGLTGIFTALWLYRKQNDNPDKIALSLRGLYRSAYHKFYIDELYAFVTKKVLFNLVGRPAAWFDKNVVDGLVNFTGNTTQFISEKIKKAQSGKVQQYAIYFLAGIIGLAVMFIYLWK